MAEPKQHTSGAMKVAEIILNGQEVISTRYGKKSVFGIADLIDVKTAVPELLEALTEIHKLWCCPEPKTKRDWSARCDVMADCARKALAKATGGGQ